MSVQKSMSMQPHEAGIVIIGGGGAGLCAAVAAAQKGVSNIVVLEKRHNTGGNSASGGGPFAVESPVQQRYGIKATCDDYFKIAMDWSHWKVDARIVRAYIAKSGETISWLEDMGLTFQPPEPMGSVYHVPVGEGFALMKALRTTCEKWGITILTETPAVGLETGESGNIEGVRAMSAGGAFTIQTRSVVIATGGYGSNAELLKKYIRNYCDEMEYIGIANNGDGFLMAVEAGAAVENPGTFLVEGPHVPTGVRLNITTPDHGLVRMPLVALAWEPYMLWLNNRGRRFMAEDTGPFQGGNAVTMQPNNEAFVLFDQTTCQQITEQGVLIGRPLQDCSIEAQHGPMPNFAEELQRQVEKGRMCISDSLAEMAAWIGSAPQVLQASVDEYNKACDAGYDHLFLKEAKHLRPLRQAPYYALKCNSVFLDTIGGIRINERMEVLNKHLDVIPGLYAAGVVTGGWEDSTYCFLLLGSARGFALNSGRIAGENAAAFVANVAAGAPPITDQQPLNM